MHMERRAEITTADRALREDETPCFLLCQGPGAEDLYAGVGAAKMDVGTYLWFPAHVAIPPVASTGGRATIVDLGVRVRCALSAIVRLGRGAHYAREEQYGSYQIVPHRGVGATPLGPVDSVGVTS